jgi:hypothetical protein
LTVTQLEIQSNEIPNTMSESKSINTLLLEIIISSKYESITIRDLNNHTLQILSNPWWASMNVDLRLSIAWDKSSHTPSWRFYLHCRIEETGSPGIIRIVCYQFLHHPSEHDTSSMGKHLLATAHITKLNKLT